MTREEQIRKEASKYFDDYLDGLKGEVLTVDQTFEDGAKWADKTMIDKACEWMQNNMYCQPIFEYDEDQVPINYVIACGCDSVEGFINKLKKAMQE